MHSATLEHLKSNSLSSLVSFGVYPKLSEDKRFCNLDYDQIEAKNGHTIVEECRGLVIRKPDGSPFSEEFTDQGEFVIVCRTMRRFYHYESAYSAPIDPATAFVMEKLDGSCIKVWWDETSSEWKVGTRGTPIANTKIGGMHKESEFTFSLLFKSVVKDFEKFCSELDKKNTYVFELCSAYNQVVVSYPEPFITMLAVIETATGKEYNIWKEIPESSFYNKIKTFPLSSREELFDYLLKQDPSQFEGFVLMDQHFNRAKCKHPGYDALNQMKSSLCSYRNILTLILIGKMDDALPLVFGSVKEECLDLEEKVRAYMVKYEEIWAANKTKFSTRKEFALWCQANGHPMEFFARLYDKKVETFKDAVLSNKEKDGSFRNPFLDSFYKKISS